MPLVVARPVIDIRANPALMAMGLRGFGGCGCAGGFRGLGQCVDANTGEDVACTGTDETNITESGSISVSETPTIAPLILNNQPVTGTTPTWDPYGTGTVSSGTAPVGSSTPAPVVNVYTNSSGQQASVSSAPSWVQSLVQTLATSGMKVVQMAATPSGYYQATIQNPNGTTSTVTYQQPAGSQSLTPPGTSTVGSTTSSLLGSNSSTLILIAVVGLFGFMLVKGMSR